MPLRMYTNYTVDILRSLPKQKQRDEVSFYSSVLGGRNGKSFSLMFPHILHSSITSVRGVLFDTVMTTDGVCLLRQGLNEHLIFMQSKG